MGQHLQQFGCFTAVGQQQADVLGGHNPQIAMECVGGIEEQGHQPDRGEGGRDLAGHDAALAHTRNHQLGLAIGTSFQQSEGRFHLVAAQAFGSSGDR